jgi:ribosomal protein S18 acetylase RimI-like enzyme
MKDCMVGNIFNYSIDEVRNTIDDKEYLNYIFFKNRQPLGFGISNISTRRNRQENGKIIYIEQIAVLLEYRRKGAGGDIIRFLNKIGSDMDMGKSRLHVYRDNTNALNLYKRLGYREIKSIGFWQKYIC